MTRFSLVFVALSIAACEAPNPSDAPAVEILPEVESAAAPRAGAIVPSGLPQADVAPRRPIEANAMPMGGGCGQAAAAPVAVQPQAGGCGQPTAHVAAAAPGAAAGGCGCGGTCDGSCAGNCDGSCGREVAAGAPTRSALSVTEVANFPRAPRLPRQPTEAGSGSCGH